MAAFHDEVTGMADVIEVECPICQAKVPQAVINRHIDSNCQVTAEVFVAIPPFFPRANT